MTTDIKTKSSLSENVRIIIAHGKLPAAILLAIFLHSVLFKTISFTFPVKAQAEIPSLTFLGPILSAHDFFIIKGLEDQSSQKQLPPNSDFVDSQGRFSPTVNTPTDKSNYAPDLDRRGNARQFTKGTFLDKAKTHEKEQQELFKELGIEPQVPRYHSLRSFHTIKN